MNTLIAIVVVVCCHTISFVANVLGLIFHQRFENVLESNERFLVHEDRPGFNYLGWFIDVLLVALLLSFLFGLGGSFIVFAFRTVISAFIILAIFGFFCVWILDKKISLWGGNNDWCE